MTCASSSDVSTESDYEQMFIQELNGIYSKLAPDEVHGNLLSSITGLKISITGFDIYRSLYYLSKLHQNEELEMFEMKSIHRFWHSVRCYSEMKNFFYKHNYLEIAKLLLDYCTAPLCRTIVMNTIVELVEDKTEFMMVKLDVIERIGNDLELVYIITSYLQNFERYVSESCLLHNILRFFNLVVSTVTFCPLSPWVDHLNREHLHLERCIIFVLENISLPDYILQGTLDMLWKLIKSFPDSSISLNNLFNLQKLLNGLVNCAFLRFLIDCDDGSLINWQCLQTWVSIICGIRESIFTQQFADTASSILHMLRKQIDQLHKKLYQDEVDLSNFSALNRVHVGLIITRLQKYIENLRDTLAQYSDG